jgi:hypothetical protein
MRAGRNDPDLASVQEAETEVPGGFSVLRGVASARGRGLGSVHGLNLIPTLRSDARRSTEAFAQRYVDEEASHPVLGKVIRELDESAALREQLAALDGVCVPFHGH